MEYIILFCFFPFLRFPFFLEIGEWRRKGGGEESICNGRMGDRWKVNWEEGRGKEKGRGERARPKKRTEGEALSPFSVDDSGPDTGDERWRRTPT